MLNMPAMARVQSEFPGKAVIIEGMFSHINFVKDMDFVPLKVIDLIPPEPSKLRYLVNLALSTGMVDRPVVPEYIDINLNTIDPGNESDLVMFPCETSGAESDREFCFLDQLPELDDRRISLIGCNLSKRIFDEYYGKGVKFIDICPKDRIHDRDTRTIVRCCRVKEGYELDGNIVQVPWGVTVPELIDALNALFSE